MKGYRRAMMFLVFALICFNVFTEILYLVNLLASLILIPPLPIASL